MTEEQKDELYTQLIHIDGYFHLREIPYRGICGLSYMAFTVGLFYGLDRTGYKGRYCFDNLREAIDAIDAWTGLGDPPGEWIKHKGKTEYRNEVLIIQKKYMETGVKSKVIAVESLKDGVLRAYGQGEYLGQKIPDFGMFKEHKIENPCIQLDNGKLVWGFMCWWGEVEEFENKFAGAITSRITVDLPEEIGIYEPKSEASESEGVDRL